MHISSKIKQGDESKRVRRGCGGFSQSRLIRAVTSMPLTETTRTKQNIAKEAVQKPPCEAQFFAPKHDTPALSQIAAALPSNWCAFAQQRRSVTVSATVMPKQSAAPQCTQRGCQYYRHCTEHLMPLQSPWPQLLWSSPLCTSESHLGAGSRGTFFLKFFTLQL